MIKPHLRSTSQTTAIAVLALMLALATGTVSAGDVDEQSRDLPSVFLDCRGCDFSYIRIEIPFVNWVRDREDAVVHVLITDQPTGSGGREYILDFIGLKRYSETDQNLRYVAPPDYTHDERRDGLTGILKAGLLPYLETPLLSSLSVTFDDTGMTAPTAAVADPWDSWVFEVEASGYIEQQATRTEQAVDGAFSADRVTEELRLRSWAYAEYERDRFESGENRSTSASHKWVFGGMVARSLGSHWSLGAYWRLYSDSYDNTDLGMRFTPALEYSLWDYAATRRRSLTFAYTIGPRAVDYVDVTILGETSETRFDHSLDIDLRLTQPWGSVRASLEGSHYFHDLDRYRMELYTRLSVRLFRGLSLTFRGSVERINDQLSLPRGDATVEEILLQRRQLATDYEVVGRIGLSYTFGSMYNNVVNTRL